MKYIIALIGKAGAGKDTIAQELVKRNPSWNMIVSCTTRPRREGEVDGVNYYYLTPDEFIQKILNGDMLEATCFNDWNYGTMASSLREGVNVGVFNPTGYECFAEMSDSGIQVIGVYVCADAKTRLLRQLNREEDPNVPEIIRRFTADEKDFYHIDDDPTYPIVVINNGKQVALPDVVDALDKMIHASLDDVGDSV